MKSKEMKKQIRDLYLVVQANKAALANAAKGIYITDGNFRVSNASAIISIKTETNILRLRDAYASLLEVTKSKAEANKILGIEEAEIKHMGATVAEWTSDFKTRIAVINNAVEVRNLERDEARLKAMDPTLLQEIEFEEMSKRNAAIAATQTQAGAPAVAETTKA